MFLQKKKKEKKKFSNISSPVSRGGGQPGDVMGEVFMAMLDVLKLVLVEVIGAMISEMIRTGNVLVG